MEFRVLKYFLMVAREESITKAAERLHITQPTLSRQMAELEADMGVSLLVRGGRKIGLTPEGVLLRRRAEEIIFLVDKTEMEISESQEHLEGTITVGSGDLSANRGFIRLIKKFQERHPEVKFTYFSAITDELCERMNRGLIDVSLLVKPFDVEKYDYISFGEKEPFGVFLRPDDPLAQKESICLEDLKGKPIIMTTRKDLTNYFLGSEQSLAAFKIDVTVNLPNNAMLMVEEGMGYFMSYRGVMPHLDESRVCFRPFSSPKKYSTTALAWRRNQPFSRAAAAFITYLKEELEEKER